MTKFFFNFRDIFLWDAASRLVRCNQLYHHINCWEDTPITVPDIQVTVRSTRYQYGLPLLTQWLVTPSTLWTSYTTRTYCVFLLSVSSSSPPSSQDLLLLVHRNLLPIKSPLPRFNHHMFLLYRLSLVLVIPHWIIPRSLC